MDSVVLLSVLDYLFIIAGFFLFFSLHSLVMKRLSFDDRLVLVPKLGMGADRLFTAPRLTGESMGLS